MGRRTLDNIDQKIIRTTIKIGAEKGAEHVSTLDLAKKLGISEGTIFVHFKTKSNLLAAARDYVFAKIQPAYDEFMEKEVNYNSFYEFWLKIMSLMYDNPDYTKFFYSYSSIKFEPEIRNNNKEVYVGLMKKVIGSMYPSIDEKALYYLWIFTAIGSLRYASTKISLKKPIEDNEETRFMFRLIYGVFFNRT